METVALVRWDGVEEEAMVAADLSSEEKGGWLVGAELRMVVVGGWSSRL